MERVNLVRQDFAEGAANLRRRGVCREVLLIGVLLCSLGAGAQAQQATEYQVKAAFLYNFAKFVDWPAEAFPNADSSLQICVLGPDPFDRDFEQLIVEKTVNGHRIEVVHPDGLPQARACHILFIASVDKQQIGQILRALKGGSVLTVGDTPGFAQMGGIVNFVLDENRVRFEINLKAAAAAQLKISARLLTVAKVVLPADQGGEN